MFQSVTQFIVNHQLGDWASVIGLCIAVVGFAATIYNVLKAKKAAEQAEEAVSRVRRDAARMHAVGSISTVVTAIDEIKRLHRRKDWALLPDRYSNLRKSLILIRETTHGLNDEQRQVLQEAIQQFAGIERKLEKALFQKAEPESAPRLNSIVSLQADNLHGLMAQIQALNPDK